METVDVYPHDQVRSHAINGKSAMLGISGYFRRALHGITSVDGLD